MARLRAVTGNCRRKPRIKLGAQIPVLLLQAGKRRVFQPDFQRHRARFGEQLAGGDLHQALAIVVTVPLEPFQDRAPAEA